MRSLPHMNMKVAALLQCVKTIVCSPLFRTMRPILIPSDSLPPSLSIPSILIRVEDSNCLLNSHSAPARKPPRKSIISPRLSATIVYGGVSLSPVIIRPYSPIIGIVMTINLQTLYAATRMRALTERAQKRLPPAATYLDADRHVPTINQGIPIDAEGYNARERYPRVTRLIWSLV